VHAVQAGRQAGAVGLAGVRIRREKWAASRGGEEEEKDGGEYCKAMRSVNGGKPQK
jgi:hypothetical protein